jgi:hypothetical protein
VTLLSFPLLILFASPPFSPSPHPPSRAGVVVEYL